MVRSVGTIVIVGPRHVEKLTGLNNQVVGFAVGNLQSSYWDIR